MAGTAPRHKLNESFPWLENCTIARALLWGCFYAVFSPESQASSLIFGNSILISIEHLSVEMCYTKRGKRPKQFMFTVHEVQSITSPLFVSLYFSKDRTDFLTTVKWTYHYYSKSFLIWTSSQLTNCWAAQNTQWGSAHCHDCPCTYMRQSDAQKAMPTKNDMQPAKRTTGTIRQEEKKDAVTSFLERLYVAMIL